MKNKILSYCLFASFLLWGLYACMHDEGYMSGNTSRFFDDSGALTDI
ncbi:hypothetical protein AAE250_01840 [Bacteroides sp. GD17]|jgi:hypothetical protein|nr:hypothetical protein [uncultured Bacteroides sp.]